VPSVFMKLEALPLSPNGKIDRKALPEPDADGLVRGAYVAPRNETEEVLAGIWCEVLGLERVGVHDNFFELGGHSLLATRVIARIRSRLGVELPLRAMFEVAKLAELSEQIDLLRWCKLTKSIGTKVTHPDLEHEVGVI
jgi:acyl carrier protein